MIRIIFFIIIAFLQSDILLFAQRYAKDWKVKTKTCSINEMEICNFNFMVALDTMIDLHKRCDDFDITRPWEIWINDKIEKNKKDFILRYQSIYINRSLFNDAVWIGGYGYFYYEGILFMVYGEKMTDIFKMINKHKIFNVYKMEPFTYDPPRCLYNYYKKVFYLVYNVPCGG